MAKGNGSTTARIALFGKGTLIFSSVRSETSVDQQDPMKDELRRSVIFGAATRQMSPLRGFSSSEEMRIYKEVAPTALLKSGMRTNDGGPGKGRVALPR
jgi:hypothetical protein